MAEVGNGFAPLVAQARRVRAHAIRMATNGGCFLGASLSCADLLVFLYDRVLRVSPSRCSDPDRDYLFLSKGHDVPALYGTLAERGFFPLARLSNHLAIEDDLYWHPNRAVPGVEFHSGSLGHLLSVGMGVAVDVKLRRGPSRVFVIVGDGELDEGSNWEAVQYAGRIGLGRLTAVVIDNHSSRYHWPGGVDARFALEGWSTTRCDGRDHDAIEDAFDAATGERPHVVAADVERKR